MHLTAVCLLRDYLTPENHRELLSAAAHKTKFQVQELVASRFPRADVDSRIRKLPGPGSSRTAVPVPAVRFNPKDAPTTAAETTAAAPPSVRAAPRAPQMPIRGLIEPTSEARYRIQLNASATLKEKLELLQALTSHANASGDLAALIERAVDIAIEQAQRKRFAKTERPREPKGHRLVKSMRSLRQRTHIPNATRREVVARDGMRCAFVGEGGHRCTARAFLQIHHEHPWARGGADDVDNLHVLCGRHNRLLAEQDFGATHIAERVAARRTGSNYPSPETFVTREG